MALPLLLFCGAGQAFAGVAVGEELPPKLAQMLYDRIVGASCHPQVGLPPLFASRQHCTALLFKL
jgi:hypothetical protein